MVRWQESHDAVVGRWPDGLPFALEPLWHVAHVPGATPVCENVAGIHAVVRWHVSHDWVVMMWFDGLPLALEPLWQVAHVPGVTVE